MGPYGRQALRVMYAAKMAGLPYVSTKMIARVLGDCGVSCTEVQIGSALGSLVGAYGHLLQKHQGEQVQDWFCSPRRETLGWSITEAGALSVTRTPEWMREPQGRTSSYRYTPICKQLQPTDPAGAVFRSRGRRRK